MKGNNNISVKDAMHELLETSIFKKIAKRNNKFFAEKLAMWLVRYILFISSVNESLGLDLEEILVKLHGEKFTKILNVTESMFQVINGSSDNQIYSKYVLKNRK